MTNCSPRRREFRFSLSSWAIAIAPRPFSTTATVCSLLRRSNCWRAPGNSPHCLVRGCRTYGSSGTVSAFQRWICSMAVSFSSSVLQANPGKRQHLRSQHHVGLSWRSIGWRSMGICWIGKIAGGRSSGCQARAPCWSVLMALWRGVALCRSALGGGLGRYSPPSWARLWQVNRFGLLSGCRGHRPGRLAKCSRWASSPAGPLTAIRGRSAIAGQRAGGPGRAALFPVVILESKGAKRSARRAVADG